MTADAPLRAARTGTPAPGAPATAPGAVLPPLRIGRHVIESPVVLAPMAGITNRAFRRLCREYGNEGTALATSNGRAAPRASTSAR